jgi:hypothetical protein
MRGRFISGIRRRFQRLSRSQGQVTHVLLTRSPLIHPASWASSFDLHVLSTPPAFVLSQDQTLRKRTTPTTSTRPAANNPYEANHPVHKTGYTKNNPTIILRNQPKESPDTTNHHPERGSKPAMPTRTKNLALTNKHTVEFSNNRHTPTQHHPTGQNLAWGNLFTLPE